MKIFYAINLNNKHQGLSRWALYEMTEEGFDVVWPRASGSGKERPLLPNQKFSTLRKYPAYHFQYSGCGLSHLDGIADGLAQHFKQDVKILELHGMSPSPYIAIYREV